MNAFITGGAGFIGSHLAEALLAAGHEVIVLDDLSTGAMENIEHLKSRAGLPLRHRQVTNEPLLAELVDGADVVFHLAAAVGVKLIVEAPVHTIETNVHGTEVVLKHANKKKKPVVIASTSEVYGKSTEVPFREDADLVLGPTPSTAGPTPAPRRSTSSWRWPTGKSGSCRSSSCGFFNTVGPRQTGRYGMVIPNFVRQALAGQPITVSRRRHADALLLLRGRRRRGAAAPGRRPRAIGEVFNVGNTAGDHDPRARREGARR